MNILSWFFKPKKEKNILSSYPDAVLVVSESGELLYANENLLRILKISSDELFSLELLDIFDGGFNLVSNLVNSEDSAVVRSKVNNDTELFLDKLLNMRADGFQLFIIGTYDDEMYEKKLHLRMMEFCLAMGKGAPSLRFNYRYPAGRALGQGVMLSPENFASLLIETYDLWREAQPDFRIFPQVQMMQLLQSNDTRVNQCPWTRQCTGKFFGLEADGSIFNCCTFSDTNDDDYRFGNLRTHTVPELLNSLAARRLKRRRVIIDKECLACEFHHLCHGGCARDTILYGKGLYEKTFYCESWKKVFKYIKDSMEADAVRTDNLPEAEAFSQKEVETWSAYI